MIAQIALRCARSDCDATETVNVDETFTHELLDDIVFQLAPGWGLVAIASGDRVMRCPEHQA